MKIVNFSGFKLGEHELAMIYTKFRVPPTSEIFSEKYRYNDVDGLRAGYVDLMTQYGLSMADIDNNTLIITPNIANSETAAREMFGERPLAIVNIHDISQRKREREESPQQQFRYHRHRFWRDGEELTHPSRFQTIVA